MTAGTVPASSPSRGGIDYSKFDAIEDSDDEKPQTSQPTAKQAEVERPHCHNCHKDVQKPLRCGVCKKVAYCSAQCQKDDWPYHKRTCKKPEEKKAAVSKPPERKPPSGGDPPKKKKEEDTVVETEENLTWYRHREWKPSEEPKREFTPSRIESASPEGSREGSGSPTKPQAGSIWNAAGTWEEKDVTDLARKTLRERLSGLKQLDTAGGQLLADDVEAVEGDASKPVVRGKLRHIFDLSFKVKFSFKWMDSEGQRKAEGTISVGDFTNDTFTEGVLSPPAVELSFKDSRLLDAARRQAVEASVGASSWPPSEGSLMAEVSGKMREWAKEYEQAT